MSQDKPSIRVVTTELEHGNASYVSDLFSGKSEDQRLAELRTMQQLYQADVKSGATKADLTFNTYAYYNPNITIKHGDEAIYDDTFDVRELKHTDPNDKVPQDRQPIDAQQVRQVTTDLENGHPESLNSALSGKFLEERARFLKSVEALNQQDVASHKTLASLCVSLAGPKGAGNEITVTRDLEGGSVFTRRFWSNVWSNPASLYHEKFDLENGTRRVDVQTDPRQ